MFDPRALILSHLETLTPAQALDLLPSLSSDAVEAAHDFAVSRTDPDGWSAAAHNEALAWVDVELAAQDLLDARGVNGFC